MAFLKRNWIMVALAVLGVAGLGGAVWQGMDAFNVPQAMQPAVNIGRDLQNLRNGKGVNTATIEEQKRGYDEIAKRQEQEAGKVESRQRNVAFDSKPGTDGKLRLAERKPLVDGVLPEAREQAPKLEFRKRYQAKLEEIVKRLHGGERLTDTQIAEFRSLAAKTVKQPDQPQPTQTDPWAVNLKQDTQTVVGEEWDRARTILKDPAAKESLANARKIWMYVDDGAIAEHPMARSSTPPSEIEMWQAQMLLWIQEDLACAMARVNEAAADKYQKEGHPERIWVAYMPIKRLEGVYVHSAGLGGPGFNSSGGGGQSVRFPFPSFTKQDRNEKQFLAPIALRLVMEPEALPALFRELTDVGFYNIVSVEYDRARIDPMQVEYVFGPKPVFNVVINIEGYYLHSVFDKWMPPTIKTELSTALPANLDTGTGDTSGGAGPGGRFRGRG